MSKLTPDQLWKSIIEDLFEEFVHFFFEEDANQIDFSKGYEFLNQELQTINPISDAQHRRVDKLVKVFRKDGIEEWILILVEVQGYKDDKMAWRVYNSHYRITDKYKKPVTALVIYTDDNQGYHPKEYRQSCLGTEVIFRFNTFKLLDNPPQSFSNKDNLFAIVMEIAWYSLKRNKLKDLDLLKVKTTLVKKLTQKQVPKQKIFNLIEFIRHLVRFEKKEFISKFEKNIQPITKKYPSMGIQELLMKTREEEGMEKGMEIGIEKTLNIISLIKEGKSVASISKQLDISKEIVLKVKKSIEK